MTEANINELKERVDILEVARSLGIEINKHNKALCIFPGHIETKPSLSFDIKKNRFKCFGCGKGGDVITLIEIVRGLDFKDAIKELESIAGGVYKPAAKIIKTKTKEVKDIQSIEDVYKKIYADFRAACGNIDKQALDYLTGETRGLIPETITRFNLFSIENNTAIKEKLLSRFNLDDLKGSGLFNNNGELLFWSKIIIPFYQGDDIIFLQGRIIGESSGLKYLNLSGRSCPLYNSNTLKEAKPGEPIYICEGVFDCLMLEQAGLRAVGVLGTNNFKGYMFSYFKHLEPVICFDNDKSGQDKAKELQGQFLEKQGQLVKIKQLPQGVKDITEYFLT